MTDNPIPGPAPTAPNSGFILSGKLYDRAKAFTTIILPAFGAFYAAVGGIWGAPHVTEIVGTIAALTTFLGVVLGISAKTYKTSDTRFAGAIDVETDASGKKIFTLDLGDTDPHEIEMFPEITFKVNSTTKS